MAESYFKKAVNFFFEYETPKIVHIKSKTVGALNRFIQLCIIGYVIGYAIVYQKGYQEFETAQSAVTNKLKGIVKTKIPSDPNAESRIWDAGDYSIPPQENGAFFVMTKVLVTSNQTLGICPEDWNVEAANCTDAPNKCVQFKGKAIPGGNGIATGKCISAYNSTKPSQVCEVEAWCPVEIDDDENFHEIDNICDLKMNCKLGFLTLVMLSLVAFGDSLPSWIETLIKWVPGVSASTAAAKMYAAYIDMRNAKWKNCDKYFHCRGNYDAQKCCGWIGKQIAELISDAREWIQGGTDSGAGDSAADQEANRYGRNGQNCERRYILDTMGKGSSIECSLPVHLRGWKP